MGTAKAFLPHNNNNTVDTKLQARLNNFKHTHLAEVSMECLILFNFYKLQYFISHKINTK